MKQIVLFYVLLYLSLSANELLEIRLLDNGWRLIGVNGGFIETNKSVSIPNNYNLSIEETLDDNLSTTSNDRMISFKVIDHNSSGSEFSIAKLFYDGSDHTFDGSYRPVEMYAYIDNGDNNLTPDVRISFQNDFDSETFYLLLGTEYYSGRFNQTSSYENPYRLTPYGSLVGTEGNLSIEYVFDRNITNNPEDRNKDAYTYEKHHDNLIPGDILGVFHYDRKNHSWHSYINQGGTIVSGDLRSFEKGKAYWVNYDAVDDSNTAVLIFGAEGIQPSDYDLNEIDDGWNMLSFNESNLIKSSATGMIITLRSPDSNTPTLKLTDDTDTEEFTYTFHREYKNNDDKSDFVEEFNIYFSWSQINGHISPEFNIRAYPTDQENKIVLLSDKKFRLIDEGASETSTASGGSDSAIVTATSLGGKNLYVPSLATNAVSGADINTTPVESIYGEYTLAFTIPSNNPGEDFGDNEFLDTNGSIKLGNENEENSSITKIQEDFSTAKTNIINSMGNGDGVNVLGLDIDFNEINDTFLLVAPNNFYVRDLLETRIFKVNSSAHQSTTLSVVSLNKDSLDQMSILDTISLTTDDDTASEIATKLDDSDYLKAKVGNDGLIYVIANGNEKYIDFEIKQETDHPRLIPVESSENNLSFGTIEKAYLIRDLATVSGELNNSYSLTFIASSHKDEDELGNSVWWQLDFLKVEDLNMSVFEDSDDDINDTKEEMESYEYILNSHDDENFTALDCNNSDFRVAFQGGCDDASCDKRDGALPDTNESYKSGDVVTQRLVQAIDWYIHYYRTNVRIDANYTDNTIYLYGGFYLSVERNRSVPVDKEKTDINITTDKFLGSCHKYYAPRYSLSDVKYDKLWAGDISTDMNSSIIGLETATGKKVVKILSTDESATKTDLGWNFVDLTKSKDKWFDKKDSYSLFSFDVTKGYWVYLKTFPIPFEGLNSYKLSVNIIYDHKFLNDTNDSTNSNNYTSSNIIRNLSVAVDLANIDLGYNIDRVVTLINGREYLMTQSGNQYTVDIENIKTLGDNPTADINVSFFATDGRHRTTGIQVDNQKPNRPTVTIVSSDLRNVTFNSSADTRFFFLYSGDIKETSPTSGGTLVEANISATNGSAENINLCAKAKNFNSNLGAYRILAMDTDDASSQSYPATIDYNRVSDIGYLISDNYNASVYPIYKNGAILSVAPDETDSIPVLFDENCSLAGDLSTDQAVELIGGNYNIKVAFPQKKVRFAYMAPGGLKDVNISVYNRNIAEIKFDGDSYYSSDDIFLLEYNGEIYKTTWDILVRADGSNINFTDENISMVPGQTISEN